VKLSVRNHEPRYFVESATEFRRFKGFWILNLLKRERSVLAWTPKISATPFGPFDAPVRLMQDIENDSTMAAAWAGLLGASSFFDHRGQKDHRIALHVGNLREPPLQESNRGVVIDARGFSCAVPAS
jgi:hypothetical protein